MHKVMKNRRWSGPWRLIVSVSLVVVLGSFVSGSLLAQEIAVDPASLNFGKVVLGGSSALSLTITNEGTEDLVVTSIAVDNRAFAVDTESMTLMADSSAAVSVTFMPGTEGEITGTLTISSNDADDPTLDVPLSGTGANVEATVTVMDGYGDPGTTGNKVSILLDNSLDVAGLNFTIHFDPDLLTPTDVVPTDRTADMSIFSANLELGPGLAILVIADLEAVPISAGSGAIATFFFDVDAGASLGQYPLTLTDVILADVEGKAILTDVTDGVFNVTGPSGAAWSVSVTVTSDDPEEIPVALIFGANPNGTDGFNAGLDQPMPPVPPELPFYAYFSISGLFEQLSKDIRSSMDFELEWFINISNCGEVGGIVSWNPGSLPDDAVLQISGMTSGTTVNMRDAAYITFGECEVMHITYAFEDQTPPADVTDLRGLAGDMKAILMWTPSLSLDVRGYYLLIDSAGVRLDEIDLGDISTYTAMGLTNLVWYTFTVMAYDEVGNTSSGVSVEVMPNPESFAILLTLGSSEHDDTARVYFGGDEEGTDGFDAGLDYACPPPPPTAPDLDAYFPIDHPIFEQLCTDIRSSTDSTVVWTLVTTGSGGEICWDPDDLPSGIFILVLSPTNEIYMRDQSCADFGANDTLYIFFYQYNVSVEPHRDVPAPDRYLLVQNYPNPFNPETTIGYQIPEGSQVRLQIYNVLGQHIRTLVDARQEAGSYTVVWDGMDSSSMPASSGVYFYRFQAGEYSLTKSMLLIK